MKVLFFDTETNGLPKNWKAPMLQLENWPRVIQFAYMMVNVETEEILIGDKSLVKPDNWTVPKEKFWIDNSYSTEECEKEGKAMPELLDEFLFCLNQSNFLVAHNLNFDYNVVGAEMIRYGKRGKKIEKQCTMMSSIDYVNVPFSNGKGKKFPSLTELHKKCFDKTFQGAHDAMADVIALKDCYFHLIKQGILTLNI